MEKIDTPTRGKTLNSLYNAITIISLALALSGCLSKEKKYQELSAEVQQLEYKLKQQSENYRQVSLQENIQQDLKNEGADPTINQEIGYSLDRAIDQDEKIAKTKKKLSEAQKKLAKIREELANDREIQKNNRKMEEERLNTRLNPEKYDYIKEEYKRSRNN